MSDSAIPTTKPARGNGPVAWALCFLAVAVLILLYLYSLFGGIYSGWILSKRGQSATAVVMSAGCDKGNRSINACRAKVSFPDTSGKQTTAKLDVTRAFTEQIRTGEAIPVTYDPKKPIRARIAVAEYDKPFWKLGFYQVGLPIIVVLTIIIGSAWLALKLRKK